MATKKLCPHCGNPLQADGYGGRLAPHVEVMRTMLSSGMTPKDVARELVALDPMLARKRSYGEWEPVDATYVAERVAYWARTWGGFDLMREPWEDRSARFAKRRAAMLARRREGLKYREIGAEFGITTARAREVCESEMMDERRASGDSQWWRARK